MALDPASEGVGGQDGAATSTARAASLRRASTSRTTLARTRGAMGLERKLTTATLTLQGVGVIIGAGIYVLVGTIAATVGNGVWLALLGAAVAALPTGLSYAELASRYPRSAGEAVYVERAFGREWLSFLVGFAVLASGVASTAAVSHGFATYLGDLLAIDRRLHLLTIALFLAALTWLNHRGIREAAWVNASCTIASLTGLVVLVIAGLETWGTVDPWTIAPPGSGSGSGSGSEVALSALLAGAALAFYAYIGFEDMCNVAEEVEGAERAIPRAILLSLAITTVVYVLVGLTVVNAVPVAELVASDVPLMLVAERLLPSWNPAWLGVIALLAVVNTALFNLIMGSRILYGMGAQGLLSPRFAWTHPRRKTPTLGVLVTFVLALAFALTGVLRVLAEATNTVVLAAFFSVNLALLVVKRRRIAPDDASVRHFSVPWVVPVLGLVSTAYLATQFSPGAYVRAAGLVAVGGVLHVLHRWSRGRGAADDSE